MCHSASKLIGIFQNGSLSNGIISFDQVIKIKFLVALFDLCGSRSDPFLEIDHANVLEQPGTTFRLNGRTFAKYDN